jgi:hypothetical protein
MHGRLLFVFYLFSSICFVEMKFLELSQVNSFNNLFGNLTTPDGSRLQIRLEIYTCIKR